MSQVGRATVAICSSDLLANPVKRDENTVLVLWGTRHGNRNPEQFLEVNPRTWGFEGNMELTTWGRKQAYGLGKELRKFVGNLCDLEHKNGQVQYYTSSASRCQATLQTAVASFHALAETPEWWTQIPYTIDDKLLRTYSLSDAECPNIKKVWDPISNDSLPHLALLMKEKSDLLNYLAEQTKWDIKHLGIVADVADNLIEMDLYGVEYPEWILKPKLSGYTAEKLKQEIMEFAEIHQNACTDYKPCRLLMAGVWLAHILRSIDDAQKRKGPAVIGYSSHTEVTLSVMKQMGVVRNELTTSAGFVLEFRLKPFPSVRILNHDPNPIERHIIYKAEYVPELAEKTDRNGFIPLQEFLNFVRPKAIIDWVKACGSDCSASWI